MKRPSKEIQIETQPGVFISIVPMLSRPRLIVDMSWTPSRLFPSFVKYLRSESKENLTIGYLEICGKEYQYHPADLWIDPAIFLAARWKAGEQSYDRIRTLRDWLRENSEHGHDLDYEHLRSMQECLEFMLSLAALEFPPAEVFGEERYKSEAKDLTDLFTNDPNKS